MLHRKILIYKRRTGRDAHEDLMVQSHDSDDDDESDLDPNPVHDDDDDDDDEDIEMMEEIDDDENVSSFILFVFIS